MNKNSQIIALAKSGMPPRHIHARLAYNVTIGSIYATISKARRAGQEIPLFSNADVPRETGVVLQHVVRLFDARDAAVLDRHCARRRLSRQELLKRLVETVLRCDLIDAVLDDGGGDA